MLDGISNVASEPPTVASTLRRRSGRHRISKTSTSSRPASDESLIIQLATLAGTLSQQSADLDEINPKTTAINRQIDRLDSQVDAIERTILELEPTTTIEAVVLLMHATFAINHGNAFEDMGDEIELGEFAARAATLVLIKTLDIDATPFRPDRYLPDYLVRISARARAAVAGVAA